MRKESSAGAVVFFQKGKKREYLLLNYLGGHWDFPKGHIELHENPYQTVLREIKEETGLDVKIIPNFERKITYSFKHQGEFIIKDVVFYLAQAKSQNVKLSKEHKGYVWLPYKSAYNLITFNKEILKSAENFLRKNFLKINKFKKGFTLVEILIVLSIILVLFALTLQVFKPSVYFQKTRDIKRISDIKELEMALKTYLLATSSPSLGPFNKGVDESSPTIFVSVPYENEDIRNKTLFWNGRVYYFNQVSTSTVFKNDSSGWIPVNFSSLIYPPLFSLPVDPVNSFNKKLFYSYVFKRSDSAFEINANLEFSDYKFSGKSDQVSVDGGDNNNILEVGNNKNLMPNNLY